MQTATMGPRVIASSVSFAFNVSMPSTLYSSQFKCILRILDARQNMADNYVGEAIEDYLRVWYCCVRPIGLHHHVRSRADGER
jgi:hypothetical protein